jgi:Protein of unknown function (DUF3723)
MSARPTKQEAEHLFAKIEKELLQYKIGTVKIKAKDMTFKRKEVNNPTAADESRLESLRKSMLEGINRTDITNRISGCVDIASLTNNLYDAANYDDIKVTDIERLNKDGQYPLLDLDSDSNVEMLSGERRIRILKELKPTERHQWWLVTLYGEGNIPHHACSHD